MNNLRLLAIGSLAAVVCASGVMVACSDDTDINPTTDAGGDTSTPETSTGDSGTDAADAADTGDFDAGFVLPTFPERLADEICKSLARCCYGNANLDAGSPVDGGTYNQAACVSQYLSRGFEGSNVGSATALDAGAIQLDQAKALDCINKVSTLTCDLPATEYDMINASCFAAYKGTLTDGTACQSSIECGPTSFCLRSTSAGTGMCAPLRAAGDPCGDFVADDTEFNLADEACSYRASGIPDLHCDSIADFTTGDRKPLTDWKCVANLAAGGSCVNSNWCASGICNPDGLVCVTPFEFFDSSCSSYVTPPP